jgi:hypothetical protein
MVGLFFSSSFLSFGGGGGVRPVALPFMDVPWAALFGREMKLN